LEFPDLLRLIDERSTAFRAAIAAAPSLDVQVPTCPEWTLFDLAQHIGQGRRVWAATVASGPDATAKATLQDTAAPPREREALLAWLAASTQLLLDALREAGPDRGCWAWWAKAQSPLTCAAVARRQLHEIAVHTYDAQLAAGAAEPLSETVALDGVEEFLFTVGTTTVPWPHERAVADYHATEGRSWRHSLDAGGARAVRLPVAREAEAIHASMEGTASDLVLVLYGRIALDSVKVDDSRGVFEQLMEWDPER
jgi:uncharacterized protein (TIGR03083 family)